VNRFSEPRRPRPPKRGWGVDDTLFWVGIITESVDTSRNHGKKVAAQVLKQLGGR